MQRGLKLVPFESDPLLEEKSGMRENRGLAPVAGFTGFGVSGC